MATQRTVARRFRPGQSFHVSLLQKHRKPMFGPFDIKVTGPLFGTFVYSLCRELIIMSEPLNQQDVFGISHDPDGVI